MHCSPREALVCGTKGVVRVMYPFWCPTSFSVQRMSGAGSQTMTEEQVFEFPLPDLSRPGGGGTGADEGAAPCFNFVNSAGLSYEALEVHRCLRLGLTESPAFDSKSCRAVMATIDAVRGRFSE